MQDQTRCVSMQAHGQLPSEGVPLMLNALALHTAVIPPSSRIHNAVFVPVIPNSNPAILWTQSTTFYLAKH